MRETMVLGALALLGGCATLTHEQLAALSAGPIGCKPEESLVQYVTQHGGGYYTWDVTCRGQTFACENRLYPGVTCEGHAGLARQLAELSEGHIGCEASQITVDQIATTGLGDAPGHTTWQATCRGHAFVCADHHRTDRGWSLIHEVACAPRVE